MRSFINNFFSGTKAAVEHLPVQSCDILFYDDIFPHPSSGFRIEEYSTLLRQFPDSKIVSSGAAYTHFGLSLSVHQDHIGGFCESNPDLAERFVSIENFTGYRPKLFYCVFLHNIIRNLSWLNKEKIPFAFTLYPGGGFMPGQDETEAQLKQIFSSPQFRRVIVTQHQTYNYLIENNFCKPEDILFVFGVVVPQTSLTQTLLEKPRYPENKQHFDIGFCAAKYSAYGEDKGYPLFIEMANLVASQYPFVRFHVIGGFDKDVIDVNELGDRIKFYGYQSFTGLKTIFRSLDLIVSPNQPHKLGKGSFDGFPLGTVIEAAFNQVAVMLTDCFKENKYFEDGEELFLIEPNINHILERIDSIFENLPIFYRVSKAGKEKFETIYSSEYQMHPRINLFKTLLHETPKSVMNTSK